MNRLAVFSLLALGLSQPVMAVTLTFEDIPGGSIQNTYGNMPTYKGFNFSSTLDWVDTVNANGQNSTPWPYGAISGEFTVLNNNGGVGTITKADASDFTFDGVWAKNFSDGSIPSSSSGVVSGYNNGQLVWSFNAVTTGNFQFFSGQAGQIDELRLGFGNVFMIDDLSLDGGTTPPVTAVPEPSTYALMFLGFAAIGATATRRKRFRTALRAKGK